MIDRRWLIPLVLWLAPACNVEATVGYNSKAFVGAGSCDTDTLAPCDEKTCVVSELFDAPPGVATLLADDNDVFFLSSRLDIARRAIAGGEARELVTAETPVMRMTSDAAHVFWIEQGGQLRGIAKAGGTFFEASYAFGNPTDVTLDATHLYWVLPDAGQVAMSTKPMGEAEYISGQDVPTAITTDASHVYWVNAGTAPATGQLMRAKRGDLETAELLLGGLETPVAIAAGDGAVYFASKNSVFRWSPGAVLAETVMTDLIEVKQIGAHGSTLYGVGMDGLWKVPTGGGARATLHARPMSALAVACSGGFASHWLEDGLERYGR